MYFPDLVITLSDSTISVALPVRNKCLNKDFPVNWSGIALLNSWMLDMGIKKCFVRLRVTNLKHMDMAVNIACKLCMCGNIIGLSAMNTAGENPGPKDNA